MRLAQPHFLWLLLVFPPGLLAFFWWSWRQRQKLMQLFIQSRLLPSLTVGLSPGRQKFRMACLVAAVACLILALARPQWGFAWEETKQRGLDIVVALDVSKSMVATDVAPNRLARAKLAVQDLLNQAKADRLGLVGFAGSAFLQCPLTLDDTAFRQSLDALDVNTISQGGTALADAIETALTAFKEADNYKVLVLITDGEDHDSGALDAAQKAAKAGLRIFTIGVGTPDGELLRIKDAKNREDFVRDEQGNVVKSHLNAELLQQIAGATEGGFYLPLQGTKVMEVLYERGLAPLPKSEGKEKFVRRYHERFHWLLALGIVLLALEMLWPERRRQPKRTGEAETSRKANLQAATAALVLLSVPVLTCASPSSALREYEAGNYGESLKSYEQLLKKKGDDPRLRFNAGAAAYRGGQFDEAAKQFGQAATAPDLRLQEHAYYNLGNSLFRAGEAIPDLQKRTQSWESALKQYDSALKLNTNSADAKFNRDFVKKKLEELKQQQKQDQKDQKDSQQQNQNDKPDQQKDPQQDQKQQQSQNNEQGQQQKQDAQAEQEKQQQQNQPKPEDKKDQEQQPKPSEQPEEKQPPSDEQQREAQAMAAGQMTPQQAKQLMDSLKNDEQLLIFRPEQKVKNRERPLKDW